MVVEGTPSTSNIKTRTAEEEKVKKYRFGDVTLPIRHYNHTPEEKDIRTTALKAE